jgi:hypothetical protein
VKTKKNLCKRNRNRFPENKFFLFFVTQFKNHGGL